MSSSEVAANPSLQNTSIAWVIAVSGSKARGRPRRGEKVLEASCVVFCTMLNKTLDRDHYMRKSTKIAKEDPMELFFSPLACSMSARIALAEAGAAINLVEVDTYAGRILATGEDYRAINPLGYVPALRLDDGTVLTENSAILQYVADQYPEAQLAPPPSDRIGRAKLRQWLSFISSELDAGDAADRPLRLSQRESLSRTHADKA